MEAKADGVMVNPATGQLSAPRFNAEQAMQLAVLRPSGIINYFTQFDAVKMFCAAALGKGVCYTGKLSEGILPAGVLETRRRIIDEEVNIELFKLLDHVIKTGMITLEQKTEMLDHIADSIYVLLGLAVNLGLPFDNGFSLVHQANMSKVMGEGRPIFREDGKILKPEGWKGPEEALGNMMVEASILESHQNQQHP